jgi:hypothetical protein
VIVVREHSDYRPASVVVARAGYLVAGGLAGSDLVRLDEPALHLSSTCHWWCAHHQSGDFH